MLLLLLLFGGVVKWNKKPISRIYPIKIIALQPKQNIEQTNNKLEEFLVWQPAWMKDVYIVLHTYICINDDHATNMFVEKNFQRKVYFMFICVFYAWVNDDLIQWNE